MAQIPFRRRLVRQPQGLARLAQNTIAAGAYLAVSYGVGSRNIVTGAMPDIQVGTNARGVGLYGKFDSAYSGQSPGSGVADDRYSLPSIVDFALLAVVDYSKSSGTTASILGSDGSGNRGFQFRFASDNSLQFIRFNTAESVFVCSVPAPSRRGVVLATSINGAVSVYFQGASASTTITGTPKPVSRVSLGDGFGFDAGSTANDAIFGAMILRGSAVSGNIKSLLANPWQIFESRPRMVGELSAAGLSGTVTESGTATDSCGAMLVSTVAIAEAMAAMEAQISAAAAARGVAEAAAASDTAGASTAMTVSRAESTAASESAAASVLSAAASITESAPITDTTGAQQQAAVSTVENASSADTPGAAASMAAAQVEAGAAADSTNPAGATVSAAMVEAASAADAVAAGALMVAALADVVAANDSVAALMSAAASQIETAGAVDLVSAILQGAVTFARAPTGSGYAPQRVEAQSRPTFAQQERPSFAAQARPSAIQRNRR